MENKSEKKTFLFLAEWGAKLSSIAVCYSHTRCDLLSPWDQSWALLCVITSPPIVIGTFLLLTGLWTTPEEASSLCLWDPGILLVGRDVLTVVLLWNRAGAGDLTTGQASCSTQSDKQRMELVCGQHFRQLLERILTSPGVCVCIYTCIHI